MINQLIQSVSGLLPESVYKILKGLQLRIRIQKYSKPKCKVVVGAGGLFEHGWIPTNIETINLSNSSDWQKYFNKNSVDVVLAEHVWEHLTESDSHKTANILYQYIKPGGHARIAVPDGFHPDPLYIKRVDVEKDSNKIHLPQAHKVLYNYLTLAKVFESAGFDVKLLEYYDENGEFHFNEWSAEDGLIYRSERYKFKRKDVSILNMPNYTSLIIDAVKPIK